MCPKGREAFKGLISRGAIHAGIVSPENGEAVAYVQGLVPKGYGNHFVKYDS
jgi:hypothetical protein